MRLYIAWANVLCSATLGFCPVVDSDQMGVDSILGAFSSLRRTAFLSSRQVSSYTGLLDSGLCGLFPSLLLELLHAPRYNSRGLLCSPEVKPEMALPSSHVCLFPTVVRYIKEIYDNNLLNFVLITTLFYLQSVHNEEVRICTFVVSICLMEHHKTVIISTSCTGKIWRAHPRLASKTSSAETCLNKSRS